MTLAVSTIARQGHRTAPSFNTKDKENGAHALDEMADKAQQFHHRQTRSSCSKATSPFKIFYMANMHFTSEHPNAERSSQPSTTQVWDSLTKPALKELDRRNRFAEPRRHCPRPSPWGHGPLTRRLLCELRSDIQSQNTPASHFVRGCDPAALGDIQAFARHGGPDMLDLRGYPKPFLYRSYETIVSSLSTQERRGRKPQPSESESKPDTADTSTKRSGSRGAYDPTFRQRMVNSHIYFYGYEYPTNGQAPPPKPQNYNEIQKMLAEPRQSVPLPDEWYDEFAWADARITDENGAMKEVIPMIQGMTRGKFTYGGIPFNNLANMMQGKSHMPKPDCFYGAHPDQLHPNVRNELQAFVVPSTVASRPIVPNFFVEAKGPSASSLVVLNQACIAGAAGARAIHSLQTYGEQTPEYDNNAYTLSATYHSGQLKIYSHHVSQHNGPGTQPEYYMNQLDAWALTGNKETLIQGITAFRNAESWTEAQRIATIDHANAVANGSNAGEAAAANPLPPRLRPRPIPRLRRK